MKNFLFLSFSLFFTNFIWSQSQDVAIYGPPSVEVGQNNSFSFVFTPTTQLPPAQSGTGYFASSYKYTTWFISSAYSNMNNSGSGSFNDNSQSLNTYTIGQSQSVSFPIKWDDNNNQLTDTINFNVSVTYYYPNGDQAGQGVYPGTYTANINRILTPTISTPTILTCCTSPVTFTASNFGTANVFNWSVSGGTFTGSGSSISVTPSIASSAVFATCIVSRSAGLSNYNRSNNKTVVKTARTATFVGLYATTNSGADYICSGVGRQMSMAPQCGITSVNWIAPNCTINGQGTLNPTIIPTASTTGNVNIYAVVNFAGGCTINSNTRVFNAITATPPPIPYGTVEIADITICGQQTAIPIIFTPIPPFTNGTISINPQVLAHPGTPRNFQFRVTYTNNCSGATSTQLWNLSTPPPCVNRQAQTVNILKFSPKLIIAPNPTKGIISVTLPETLSGNYQIFDQTNTTLAQEAKFENQSELQIELSQKLKEGIYILKVITENNTFTEKIILNK